MCREILSRMPFSTPFGPLVCVCVCVCVCETVGGGGGGESGIGAQLSTETRNKYIAVISLIYFETCSKQQRFECTEPFLAHLSTKCSW